MVFNMRDFFQLDGPVMSFLNRVADLIWLNILTILCCIPIITAGPSITAMYYVTLKMVKGEDGYITKSFFKAMKDNFRQGAIIGIIMTILGLALGTDFYLLRIGYLPSTNITTFLLIALVIIYVTIFVYIFPILARYNNSIINTFINSLLLAVSNFPKTLLLYVANIILFAAWYISDIFILVHILLGFSLSAYMASTVIRKIFDKLEEKQNNSDTTDTSETT